MFGTSLRSVPFLLIAALALPLNPVLSAEGKGKGDDKRTTIVFGAITALTDNTGVDGTVTVTFTSTKNGTSTTTDVTLDGTTTIRVNEAATSLSDFVTAVNAALADSTLAQYSGSAQIHGGAAVASRLSVSN